MLNNNRSYKIKRLTAMSLTFAICASAQEAKAQPPLNASANNVIIIGNPSAGHDTRVTVNGKAPAPLSIDTTSGCDERGRPMGDTGYTSFGEEGGSNEDILSVDCAGMQALAARLAY